MQKRFYRHRKDTHTHTKYPKKTKQKKPHQTKEQKIQQTNKNPNKNTKKNSERTQNTKQLGEQEEFERSWFGKSRSCM